MEKEEEQFCRRCGEYISYGICYPCFDKAILKAKKEVFDEFNDKRISIWDTDDIRGSSETKSGDKWVSMNIIEQLKKRHLSTKTHKNL